MMNKTVIAALLVGTGLLTTGCASQSEIYRLDMKIEALNTVLLEHRDQIDANDRCCKRNQEGLDRLYQKMVGK